MEDFEIAVDKANEVEITIYDKQVGHDIPVPIGITWLNLNDIVEALRRAKVQEEGKGGGWVTAGAMRDSSYSGSSTDPSAGFIPGLPYEQTAPSAPFGPQGQGQTTDGVEAWFSVVPSGALGMQISFGILYSVFSDILFDLTPVLLVKENVRKRPLDAGLGALGRQGALRKRKGEVHEMNGHKFVQKQFYQIILCAFCNEFLLNALGYQCEDCRYTCHKKCYEKVVTKCISKSTNEMVSISSLNTSKV